MKLPGLTDEEIRAWLAGPNVARLGTINADGSPRVTAVWYLAEEDGTVALNTYEDNVHVDNIRREPRTALLVDSCDPPYRSIHFNGEATVLDEAATPDEIARLYERYLGGPEAATAYREQLVAGGKRVNIRFTPDRQRTVDFGKLGG